MNRTPSRLIAALSAALAVAASYYIGWGSGLTTFNFWPLQRDHPEASSREVVGA